MGLKKMGELRIERTFPVPAATVFAYVTQTEHLVKWWGPEGMSLGRHTLDLTRLGDWFFELIDPSGTAHHISGVVTAVDPPRSVEFTLIVHAQEGPPSIDSVVRFEVSQTDSGALFVLTQTGLSHDDIVRGSTQGWVSTLGRLEKLLNDT